MLYATVQRPLVASVKDDRLVGLRLVLVKTAEGTLLAAADTLGAGVGSRVLVAEDRAACRMIGRPDAPLDAAVVAIVED